MNVWKEGPCLLCSILKYIYILNHVVCNCWRERCQLTVACQSDMVSFSAAFKLCCYLACTAMFLGNTWVIFSQFARGCTVVTSTFDPPKDGKLEFPSIVLCSQIGFKDTSQPMVSIEEFANNTVNPWDYIIQLNPNHSNITNENWDIKNIFSADRGHCLSVRAKGKV